jgi:hypothetical protein
VVVLQLLPSREARVDFVDCVQQTPIRAASFLRRVEWKTRRIILDRLHWLGNPRLSITEVPRLGLGGEGEGDGPTFTGSQNRLSTVNLLLKGGPIRPFLRFAIHML